MTYPGGKGKCYQHIINQMPPHTAYIESHLGSGAVMRHKKPADINIGIDVDPHAIRSWDASRYPFCALHTGDAARFLSHYEFTGGEMVYADPPYLPATRRQAKVYRHDYTVRQHEELLQILVALPCHVLVSGYWSTLYTSTLSGWRCVTFQAKTHRGSRTEHLWANYEEPISLHDGSYIGRTFRERETLRRRKARLVAKIAALAPIERNLLIQEICRMFPQAEVTA